MRAQRRVALLIETSTTYGRGILAGVAKYQATHAPWLTYLDECELRAAPPAWLLQRKWDGILCRATTPQLAQALRRRRIPTVDLNDIHDGLGLPRIQSDMRAIGRLAAIHLSERGFRNFAFCGFAEETWSAERLEGFRDQLASFDCSVAVYESPWRGERAPRWDADQSRIVKWLQQLPTPVGVMACNDVRGQHVINACQLADIYVPEQVAVIGVDNNELLCNFCNPPLSSVEPNPAQVGYDAAALLDRLIDGETVTSSLQLIAPLGVVMRHSTDALGVDAPEVVAAIAFIRERACLGLRVPQIVAHVGVSRSSLERQFRKFVGHSPQQEIRLSQLRRIKELLRNTDLPLSEVSHLAGFAHTEYMTVVFKRMTNLAPSEFRNTIRRRKPARSGSSGK